MLRKIAFLVILLVGTATWVIATQQSIKMDAHALLVELGDMLTETPKTKEEYQVLLNRIKVWQQENLREFEVPKAAIHITEPKDGDSVFERPYVEGTVTDLKAKVWVIVHPMEVSDYWVQPSITVRRDGAWKAKIYIGRPGNIDMGKRFEIMAVANPKVSLSEGKVLGGWPEAQMESQVIEVTRK